jgi:hypothetical protein
MMMVQPYFKELCDRTRAFVGLSAERERTLHELAPLLVPHFGPMTNTFYTRLQEIPRAAALIEGRLLELRRTHRAAVAEIFTASYDEAYTERLYRIGAAHGNARMPIEFMVGGMTIVGESLIPVVSSFFLDDIERQINALGALNAGLGFALMVMQESYQIYGQAERREQ